MTANAPWMAIARKYLGQKELKGKGQDNPVIVGFFAKSGHPAIKNDEVAWCSAFVNAVMYESGYKGTNNLMAKSWLNWKDGEVVSTPRVGDIVIFNRTNNPAYGHVGFFVKWDSNHIWVLGGNQSNSVSVAKYARSKLKGFRRPKVRGTSIPKMTDQPPKKITKEEILVGTGGLAVATKPLIDGDFFVGLFTIVVFTAIIGYLVWKRLRDT